MKQRTLYVFLLMVLVITGVFVGVGLSQDSITEIQRIGDNRPTGMKYDPNFHQFVWVNPQGQLVLADAKTYAPRHILYDAGLYNSYVFSHDGKRLALAIDTRVEIWNTQTGEKFTEINPDGALRTEGPLFFSDDNLLLSFNTQVRAPRELRRSENDTVNLPWIWDFEATARVRTSILRNGVTAEPFFDLRNGFLFGPGNFFITGFEHRLQLLRVTPTAYPLIAEIPSNRFEPDPIALWFNFDRSKIYVLPNGFNVLKQIDADTGDIVDVNYSTTYNFRSAITSDIDIPALAPSNRAYFSKIIGEPEHTTPNALLQRLLGDGYISSNDYTPITVALIDFLQPQTADAGNEALILYIQNSTESNGYFRFLQAERRNQFLLHPDGNHIIYRNADGRIEVFDIRTGGLVKSFFQANSDRQDVFTLDQSGDVLISDFQQFNIWTGDVLYQNFDYYVNVGDIYFSFDNEQLITITNNNWWVWDIESGDVIQQEQVNIRGDIVAVNSDRHHYLSQVTNIDGLTGMEVYNVRTGQRRNVFFEEIQDRSIASIIQSPDWEHYLIVYSQSEFGPYQPGGNIVSLYSLDEGKLWLIAGDDLPQPNNRTYGWVDNQIAYVYGERAGQTQPERIYGLQYHTTGLPQCLVDAFPQTYTRWLGLWERLATSLRSDTLGHLTEALCDEVPSTEQEIEDVFFPSPTPTRVPVTATPSGIAGIPTCLTNRFPLQAQEYAEDWRRLTEGLTSEEVEEQERLLCAGLTGSDSTSGNTRSTRDENIQVMLIDIESGRRSLGGYIPPRESTQSPNIQLVIEDLRKQGVGPFETGVISPDGTLFATKDRFGHVLVYRLPRAYQQLAADATATESLFVQQSARVISLQPTATVGFEILGEPRPTLTPTITPTAPPRTEDIYELAQRDEIEEICPADHLYHVSDPPPDYEASGRIFIGIEDDRGYEDWILEPATGRIYLDETIQSCMNSCEFSPDLNWVIVDTVEGLTVSRPDGSDRIIIYENRPGDYRQPGGLRWIQDQPHLLQYSYSEWVTGEENQVTFYRQLNPETGEVIELDAPERKEIEFDGPQYQTVESQPGTVNRYAVLRTTFNTGRTNGTKYYIYDFETEESVYFARLANDNGDNNLRFQWDEFGDLLFFQYPNDEGNEWYVFDTRTAEFSFYGDIRAGSWSRDYRYRITSYRLPEPEYSERVENEEQLPKIQIWDSETDLTRIYCVPHTRTTEIRADYDWSPDNRYVIFRIQLPDDLEYESAPTRTVVLDMDTGTVTEISQEVTFIFMWTD